MSTSWNPADVTERIEAAEVLDRIADPLRDLVLRMPSELRSALQGDWLGHPLHPVLTDLPIGFWTTSSILDLTVPRRAARTSTAMVGLGVASVLPTAASGLADWAELSRERRRVGLVHLGVNVIATAVYASSFVARVRGRRRRGIALGLVGAGLATASGYLGGHLAFGSKAHEPSSEGTARLDGAVTGDQWFLAAEEHLQGDGPSGHRTEPILGA